MKTMAVLGSFGFVLAMVGCGSADSGADSTSEDELKSASTVVTCTPVDADEACLETGAKGDYCVDQITITASAVNKAKLVIDRSSNADDPSGPPPGTMGLPLPVPHTNGPPPGTLGMPLPVPHSNGPPPGTMGMPLAGPRPITATGHMRLEGANIDGSWNDGATLLSVTKQGRTYEGSFVVAKDLSFAVSCTVKKAGGPPPGAVGLPFPQVDAGQHQGPPPGAVGLPLPPVDVDAGHHGPPPGAVGLPIHNP